MKDKSGSSHPKQVILEYFDSLVNKVDLYTEELIEKYPKHELLEVSESGDSKKNSVGKWNIFSFKTRNQLSDSSSDDSDDSINDTSDSDSDSNNEMSSDDTSDSSSDSDDDSSDFDSDSDDDDDDEETDSDDSNDSIGPRRKRRRIEVSDNDDDNNKGRMFEESIEEENEIDQNQEDKETEEDDTEDLNTYSYHDYDESDENEENMNESDEDDNEAYEYKVYGIEEFVDPYHFDHKSDRHSHLKVKDRKSITTNDYLNKMRSFLIDEIRKEENRSLELYESIKDGYNFNSYSLEEMKNKLFKKRFCFLFDTKPDLKSDDFRSSRRRQKTKKRVFSLCLIISDFYLNEAQINQIQMYFEGTKNMSLKHDKNTDLSAFILNEKNLFLQYVTQNIRSGLRLYDNKLDVLSITKRSILEFEKMDFFFVHIPSVSLSKPLKIDFSHLRSLTIRRDRFFDDFDNCEVEDLSGLANLEYLEIGRMFIDKRAFKGLPKLIKLVLDCCSADKITDKMFNSQKNLQFLQISRVDFYIRLENLKSLRVLALLGVHKFKYIKSIPTENLEMLHLNTNNGCVYIESDDISRLFKRVDLKRLPHLRFSRTELDEMKTKWFSGLTNVRKLSLCDNMLESAHFLRGLNLSHILELDLSINKIENFEPYNFEGLKSLKWLNLSNNPFSTLKAGVFSGLDNLETLLLRDIKKLTVGKKSFSGLMSLKLLDLSNSTGCFSPQPLAKSFHPATFDYLPKLEVLRIKNSNFRIKDDMIPRLKQLKKIVVYDIDLVLCKFDKIDKQAGLHFKVIDD